MLIHALICPFLDLYPTSHPTCGVQFLQEVRNLLSGDVKAISRIAESNIDALNTVDLGPNRPFSVGGCELWARLSEPRFAGQVAAAVSLVEAHSNCGKAAAVAKEVIAINYGNKTGHSIKKILESPLAGKHPKLISKGTKAAAAEAAVTAAEVIAVTDLEEADRLATEFEALGGGALTMALAQEAEPGDPLCECWLAHERLCLSEDRSVNRAKIMTARTDAAAEAAEVADAEAAAAEAAAAVEAGGRRRGSCRRRGGGATKAAVDALGALAALAPKLPKEPGGGAGGMVEDAEEIPGGPCLEWGPERN
jgi:hypothetical protein